MRFVVQQSTTCIMHAVRSSACMILKFSALGDCGSQWDLLCSKAPIKLASCMLWDSSACMILKFSAQPSNQRQCQHALSQISYHYARRGADLCQPNCLSQSYSAQVMHDRHSAWFCVSCQLHFEYEHRSLCLQYGLCWLVISMPVRFQFGHACCSKWKFRTLCVVRQQQIHIAGFRLYCGCYHLLWLPHLRLLFCSMCVVLCRINKQIQIRWLY